VPACLPASLPACLQVAGTSAMPGTDFIPFSTVVTIPAGTTTATVPVVILGDRVGRCNGPCCPHVALKTKEGDTKWASH
jgi:hypothetical protein